MAELGTLATDTRTAILDAARRRLLVDGYGGLSTRKVAKEARVPLSQLHYHFGSKQGLILALLEDENQRRLARQQNMYAEDAPLWQRYGRACDFLDDDLDSGYVRVLHEMIAAGWSPKRPNTWWKTLNSNRRPLAMGKKSSNASRRSATS